MKGNGEYTVRRYARLDVICIAGMVIFAVVGALPFVTDSTLKLTELNGSEWLTLGFAALFELFFLFGLIAFRRPRVIVRGENVRFCPRFGRRVSITASELRDITDIRRKRSLFMEPEGGKSFGATRFFYPVRVSYYRDGKLVLRYSTDMLNHKLLERLLATSGVSQATSNAAVCSHCGARYLADDDRCPMCGETPPNDA